MNTKTDKIYESKAFKCAVKCIIVTMWAISGLAGFIMIPGTNMHSQWAYGVLFAFGLIPLIPIIAQKVFWILYNNIPAFKNHVDLHYGDPNTN
jgi:hypothetical protein